MTIFRRRRHADAVRYIIYVMWLVGYSQRTIAIALGMRTKQAAGVINKSDYCDRASMLDTDRAARLAELQAIRFGDDGVALDGGVLDRIGFDVKPLAGRQSRSGLKRKVRGRA